MLKRVILVLLFMIQPMFSWAESDTNKRPETTQLVMTALDAVKMAGGLVEQGDLEHATQILTMLPETDNLPVEIERWYLLAQIARLQGDLDTAINIYRKLLDEQPDLVKIRYELALCYMNKEQWYRADYHLRLAIAGDEIPDVVKHRMMFDRYIIRQNKNWDVWFNFGAAPDSNINQVAGGEECVTLGSETYCHPLPDPIAGIGFNFAVGGNYEFKFGENWRWKSDANLYTDIYRKHDYDDLLVGLATGPRYVWSNGDIWAAAVMSRRLYGWDGYSTSYGGKIDTNYDISRRWAAGLSLYMTNNVYDEYAKYLNGQTYSGGLRLSYSFDASKYLLFRESVTREYAKHDIYKNWRYNFALGFGAALPLGFNVYLEPSIGWANYDGARWAVSHNTYTQVTERDFIQHYTLSLSNNKFDIFGFVPYITFGYTRRDSNIKNRSYDKTSVEFFIRQKF